MEKKFIVDFIEYKVSDAETCLIKPFSDVKIANASEQNREYMHAVNDNCRAFDYLYKTGIMNDIAEKVDNGTFDGNEGKIETIVFMIDTEKLAPYIDELKEKFPLNDIEDMLERMPCWISGCISVIGNMGTYRDNCGCVSKSWELSILHQYNYKTISEISDIYRTKGVMSAGKKVIDTYLHE